MRFQWWPCASGYCQSGLCGLCCRALSVASGFASAATATLRFQWRPCTSGLLRFKPVCGKALPVAALRQCSRLLPVAPQPLRPCAFSGGLALPVTALLITFPNMLPVVGKHSRSPPCAVMSISAYASGRGHCALRRSLCRRALVLMFHVSHRSSPFCHSSQFHFLPLPGDQ